MRLARVVFSIISRPVILLILMFVFSSTLTAVQQFAPVSSTNIIFSYQAIPQALTAHKHKVNQNLNKAVVIAVGKPNGLDLCRQCFA